MEIVHRTPQLRTAKQCQQSLFAASLLETTSDLLRLRSIDPLHHLPNTVRTVAADILKSPIEWSAIQILLAAPGGEHHLGQILNTYRLMQMDASDYGQLLQRVLAVLGEQELLNGIVLQIDELQRRAEALLVLETIQGGNEDTRLQMIDNLIWFRDDNVSLGHLLEVLLVTEDNPKYYSTSCLVLGAFVQTMKNLEYRKVFWQNLSQLVDNDHEANLFHKCCQVILFYESISDHIRQYLGTVRHTDLGNGELAWIGDHLEFHQVRRIVCLMMSKASVVRQRFAEQLNAFGLATELRCDLFHFLLYE